MKTVLIILLTTFFSITLSAADRTSFIAGRSAPGIENSTLHDVSEDAAGNILATGTVIADGYKEIFIAKYDSSGALLWMKQGNGGGHYGNSSAGITADDQGNAYITGTFSGAAAFDAGKLTAPGTANMFIAKFDASGNLLWMQQASGSGYESQVKGEDIELALTGELVISGQVLNKADFGSTQLAGTGKYEARYSTNGVMTSVALIP